jgi:hypothetical protein
VKRFLVSGGIVVPEEAESQSHTAIGTVVHRTTWKNCKVNDSTLGNAFAR